VFKGLGSAVGERSEAIAPLGLQSLVELPRGPTVFVSIVGDTNTSTHRPRENERLIPRPAAHPHGT